MPHGAENRGKANKDRAGGVAQLKRIAYFLRKSEGLKVCRQALTKAEVLIGQEISFAERVSMPG